MIVASSRITGQQVIAAVAEDADLHIGVLLGQSRIRPVARPRQIAAYLMGRLCPHLSNPAMGRLLGNRDHTTILHARRTVDRLMRLDPDLADQVERVEAYLVAKACEAPAPAVIPFNVLCANYAASMQRAAA